MDSILSDSDAALFTNPVLKVVISAMLQAYYYV
jgi:hypothetical protein